MLYEMMSSYAVGIGIGYFYGRESMIKLHRRLYNLNTNLNLLYAEHTEKDKIFDEIKHKMNEVPSKKIVGI